MKIQINKHVLEAFKKRLQENKSSRGDMDFNRTTGFYGNHGSVKSFTAGEDDSEELPLEPSAHMATQLSSEEPPVDDPDYVPATNKELALALSRIAREVPFDQIEKYYRKSHNTLDDVLDAHDANLFEAIDYEKIHPMHHKAIKDLINQYVKGNYSPEDAAKIIKNNRNVSRYPGVTLDDIVDELNTIANELDPQEKDTAPLEPSDPFVNPPAELKDLSPAKEKKKIAKGVVIDYDKENAKVKKSKAKKRHRKLKDIEPPSEEAMDKRAEDEMLDMLASAYSEFTEMDEYAATWDWSNYENDAPYLKVLFDIIKVLHQLSYRVLQANYINKYGGYVYDPDADVGGNKKGGFVLLQQGPTSRPEAQAMIRRIYADFGLTYENMMRQQNILKMSIEDLSAVIERAMIGIFQRVPQLYAQYLKATPVHMKNVGIEGDPQDVANENIGFFATVLAHKYKGESEILDRDLVNVAIAGIFKRCLLDLPTELGIQTSVNLSIDTLTKKKKQKTDKTFGFNLAGATRRFEKLRKDPKIAKVIKKLMPKLILGKIEETKTAKVSKKGGKYNFEDKSTGLGYELSVKELKNKIQIYVDERLKGKQPTFDEEEAEREVDLDPEYDAEAEEKEIKGKLSKDDYEVRKAVQEMEKMIASGDWMHIAPLFGFSGAPGVRQWYLRYPERKFMIMTAARSDNAPAGAKRYLDVFREMRENLGNSLITLNQNTPGVLDLMIDEIANKGSLTTSDQAMIELLEEMRGNIEELLVLYEDYDSYEELEEQNPEELKRLSNTPGGSLLRFGIGAVFDKIIKDMDTEWHSEMKAYLETKNGLKEKDARDLAYYFTGLKNKPSKGDFSEDKDKLSKAAQAFVDVGMEAEEFFEALRYSQGWFFSTLDRELRKGVEGDNYYNMVRDLTSQPLYKKDKKGVIKLDKKVYNIFKKMIEGKNGAISAYLDNLAIEEFQQATQKKIEKIKSEKPEIFMENLKNIIRRLI